MTIGAPHAYVEDMSTTSEPHKHAWNNETDQENFDYAEVPVKPRNWGLACS